MKHDNNRGTLFKNSLKEAATHPDYKGSINIDGNGFWLSAWVSTSKGGDKYLSLSARPKTESRNPAPKAESKKIDFNDEIPW